VGQKLLSLLALGRNHQELVLLLLKFGRVVLVVRVPEQPLVAVVALVVGM
jgi:hypothetical protein